MYCTANLQSWILYIYLTNIGTEYFKHGIYSPFFPLQNAVCFTILTYLVPVLFTFYIQDVLKLKNNSVTKRLNVSPMITLYSRNMLLLNRIPEFSCVSGFVYWSFILLLTVHSEMSFSGDYFEKFVFFTFLPNTSLLYFLGNYINLAPTILEVLS